MAQPYTSQLVVLWTSNHIDEIVHHSINTTRHCIAPASHLTLVGRCIDPAFRRRGGGRGEVFMRDLWRKRPRQQLESVRHRHGKQKKSPQLQGHLDRELQPWPSLWHYAFEVHIRPGRYYFSKNVSTCCSLPTSKTDTPQRCTDQCSSKLRSSQQVRWRRLRRTSHRAFQLISPFPATTLAHIDHRSISAPRRISVGGLLGGLFEHGD